MKRAWLFGLVIMLAWGLAQTGCNEKTPREHPVLVRAKQGDAQAMYDLGVAHLTTSGNGIIKPNAKREPVFWFRKAAEKGHPGAMYELAGLGGVSNEDKVMWLKKGAELGSGACVTELIKGYTHGLYGLSDDPVEAFRWVKIGWQMDFKERGYDKKKQEEEMVRLQSTYRAHLRIYLVQKGTKEDEIERIMMQIH